MRRILLAAVFLLTPVVPAAFAQTTGEIVGRVAHEQGGGLPGVAIVARGPALQGTRTAVTDTTGAYRLVLLPPGAYTVTATLQGFAPVQTSTIVALAKTATELITLRPSASAEVIVSGEAPVVDTT